MRILFAVALSLVGCGSEPAAPAPAPAPAQKVEAPAPAPAPAPAVNVVTDDGTVATVQLEGTDTMKYNTNRIVVPAGRKVKLVLTHTGKLPAATMGHNFVLLKAGSNGQAFAMKAVTAAANDYIPQDLAGQIIAHTKVIGGGESVTVEFDAPAAGEYPFLCTFPGHYAMMNGVFVVE
ncbi:MAG: azurin [Myxococcales bacterium]|nr:azurin [Myxococcales bacterium]